MSVSGLTVNGVWRAVAPAEVLLWFSPLSVPWWIAGGWALDLFLGQVSRSHADIDVGIFRADAPQVCTSLSKWEFFEAHDGALTPLDAGTAPRAAVNSLWCKCRDETEWSLELLLDEGGADRWTFRRDPRIGRALEAAIRRTRGGIPYLAPEIQLLYKSKLGRRKDQMDFDKVMPSLDRDTRAWLRDSIAKIDPRHAWLATL